MLLSFSVENFRSFRGEQTLSMLASARNPDHPEHLVQVPDSESKALPVAAMYGANGAGKTNLVRALVMLRGLVLEGTEPKKPIKRRPFLLDEKSARQPTTLTVQFVEGGHVFAYGLSVNEDIVTAEWLVLVRDGREIMVFERATSESGEVTIQAGPVLTEDTWGNHAKVLALTKVGVLPNQLFLHTLRNSLREEDQGPILRGVLRWFEDGITVIPASAVFGPLAKLVSQDAAFTEFAGRFLRDMATGVDRLNVETKTLKEESLAASAPWLGKMLEEMASGDIAPLPATDDAEMIVEKGAGGQVLLRSLRAEHVTEDGKRVIFPFSEESDGTQRVTHLLPALHKVRQQNGLFVIDEIERSLHPLLAKGFVSAFLQSCAGHGGQLVFTTHETGLLDLSLLRRDEIWFAKKDRKAGSTELYSLVDFKVRTDLRVDRAYLQGRFDAVPPHQAESPEWIGKLMKEAEAKNQVKGEEG